MADNSNEKRRQALDGLRNMPEPQMGWERFGQILNRIENRSAAPPYYSKAFLSYLHEADDEERVNRLAAEIRKQGIAVFRDRDSLNPGQPWETSLMEAIRRGSYFIACFSAKYEKRPNNFMEQELAVAIREMHEGNKEDGWLIPVRLDDVQIPPLDVGGGRTLRDLQWVDLFGDWNHALHRFFRVVRSATAVDPEVETGLRDLCSSQIESKIARFASNGQLRIPDLEERWLSLLRPTAWTPIVEAAVQMLALARKTAHPQTEQFVDKSGDNRLITITVASVVDPSVVLRHLDEITDSDTVHQSLFRRLFDSLRRRIVVVKKQLPDHPYARFVAHQRAKIRDLPEWTRRDFVHWIICEDEREIQVDLLYCPGFQFEIMSIAFEKYLRDQGKSFLPHGDIYPTSLVSGQVMGQTVEYVLQQDAWAKKAEEGKSSKASQ